MIHDGRALAAGILAAVIGLAGCSASTGKPRPGGAVPATTAQATPVVAATADPAAFYLAPSPLPPGPPGALIRAETVTGVAGVPQGATMYRVLYHSQSIYGADIAVSGYIAVPGGPAPSAGRTVMSWAHGTTGITPGCDPSLFNTSGLSRPYLTPDLAEFLSAGYVVAATDYEGLGGLQPYLLGASEARGVLDAARAAHRLPGINVSATTLIYGHSQGGHAALFAGELAPSYAPDLRVVGVAAAAPATNLTLIMSIAGNPAAQAALSFQVEAAWSWVNTYHDLPAASVFTPEGLQLAPTLVAGCASDTAKAIVSHHVLGSEIFQPGLATDPVVLAHTRLNDPGRVRATAPILVVQGTADNTVPPALTDMYVQQMACPSGDTIDYQRFTGATHGTIPTAAGPRILSWMADRIAARPAPSTCGATGDATTVAPG